MIDDFSPESLKALLGRKLIIETKGKRVAGVLLEVQKDIIKLRTILKQNDIVIVSIDSLDAIFLPAGNKKNAAY